MKTTVVGSYPTDNLPPDAALERAVKDQVEAGIDLLSDGQVRADMISLFCAHIPGCRQRPDGRWAVTERLQPPEAPITLHDWQRATALAAGRPVKGILTGPTTLACAVVIEPGAPYSGPGDPRLVADFAALLSNEAAALKAAGAKVIQVDEPFYSIGAAIDLTALGRITRHAHEPWLHVCGDTRPIWRELQNAPVSVLQAETAQPTSKTLCLGILRSDTDQLDSHEAIRERIANHSPTWISPACGLRLRSHAAARAKLHQLSHGARIQ